MRNKLKYLISVSLNKKIKTKWFVIANAILCIVICALLNMDTLIKAFGGDFDEMPEILVIDENTLYEDFVMYYTSYSTYITEEKTALITDYSDSLENAKKEVEEEDKILLVIEEDPASFIKVQMITKGNVDTMVYQIITSALSNIKRDKALEHYQIAEETLAMIDEPVVIERIKLEENQNVDEMMSLLMGTVFPIIILPFFMLSLILVQMIGAEINEEKTTKGMEIIISNVSPKVHLFSKILSGNIFVILQAILLVVYFGIGCLIRTFTTGNLISGEVTTYASEILTQLHNSGVLDSLGYMIPIVLILMLITFLAYSLLAGILASMTTNMEDYQQLQTPIMIVSLIGYYLSVMAAMFEGSLFIRILSYVPFLSALLSPALLILGQISWVDALISLVVLIVFVYLLFQYGIKIYKVGILNYSSSNLWKKMFKAMKSK